MLYVGYSGKNWKMISLILLASCFIWILTLFIKFTMDIAHKCLKVGRYNRYRNNILIGLVLIAETSIEARFKLFAPSDEDVIYGFSVLSFFTAVYYLLIHSASSKCEWKRDPTFTHRFLRCIVFFIHAFALYVPLQKVIDNRNLCIIQIYLALICASTTFGMLEIFMGTLKLKEEPEGNDLESVKVIGACPSCHAAYGDDRLPRFLIQCGHSICEKCANRQLANTNNGFIKCLECQKVTGVNGPANQLPINHALTEVIKETQEESKDNKEKESIFKFNYVSFV